LKLNREEAVDRADDEDTEEKEGDGDDEGTEGEK